MADYENLLDSIDAVIKSNNRREITGQILQNTLHQMVASLGENYQLAGFATPTLDPSEPDQNVFYLTDEAGVYTNFDNITLGNGLSFLMWKNGSWSSKTMNIVTAQWVDDNYVSKAFLRQLFRAYDEDGVEIFANDTTSIIDNIKAMCGLWTNQYLSALGLGADGGGGASMLAKLNDVKLDNLQDGQTLVYDLASNHWVNRTIQSGVDMSVVWAALAAATNEQINSSHLTTALSGYVTTTALATTLANYVTTTALAAALADYAAKSWVETNYVSKSFFNSLFQAEDSNGNAIAPNNSGQTAIDRLKILVGAYTEQYLSALGLSEEAGASSYLYGLGDVQLDTQTLAAGQALIYSAALGKWTNGEAGVNMAQVWTALATADATKQIDISHISSALSGYVTTSSLSTTLASYVTTSALSTTLADYVTNTSLTTTLAVYGTKSWVDNNYVSKAFFNRLFQAFAPLAEGQTEPTQVEPNDTTTTIDNIKAMFGLWTEQYLSALGLGSDAGHSIGVLDDLNDVTISNPQTNQVLKYINGEWVNAAAPSGASALSGLTDVAISSLADKDLLQWDYASGKWKNVVLSTAMSAYALASSIPTNVSQLNNDSGYITGITSSMVTSALGYTPANSTALSNYLPLSGGTITGNLTVTSSINCGNDIVLQGTGTLIVITNQEKDLLRGYTTSYGSWVHLSYDPTNQRLNLNSPFNATGFIKTNSDDNYVLLGGGGHAAISGLSVSYASTSGTASYLGGYSQSDFLHLSGGTMTGGIYWADANALPSTSNIDYVLVIDAFADGGRTKWSSISNLKTSQLTNDAGFVSSSGVTSVGTGTGLTGGTITSTGTISISSSYQDYISHGESAYNSLSSYLPLAGGTMTGKLIISTYSYPFELRTSGNESSIQYCPSGSTGNGHYVVGCYTGTTSGVASFFWYDTALGRQTLHLENGRLGVNTGASYPSYALHVGGDIYATGGVTALSDERHKTIVENTRLQVSDIAKMRAVRYIWDDGREDKGIHVGSIAQDWQQILPEVVLRANNDEGTLSLQYGVAALISSITIARKVVNHEERINALERDYADLKQAYSFIKNAYDYLKMDYENLKLKIA